MRREKYEEDRVKEKKNKFKLKNLFLIYFIKINFFCWFLKLIFIIFDFFILSNILDSIIILHGEVYKAKQFTF